MILLAATVCLRLDLLTVSCRTDVIRTEHTVAECVAMIRPVEEWLAEQSAGLPVVLIAAACKRGGMI
jgi:hypothetical protein